MSSQGRVLSINTQFWCTCQETHMHCDMSMFSGCRGNMVNTCEGHVSLIVAVPVGRSPSGRARREQTPTLKMSFSTDYGLKSEPPTSKDSGKVQVASVGGVTDIVTLGKAHLRESHWPIIHMCHPSGLRIWPEDCSTMWDLKL